MELTGAQIVIECLIEQGVDTVFGYPGGAILNVYDELYKNKERIRHILTAHEQGASHAADGYARATGKVGVCMATSGPGATNLVTGIATAFMDSIPLVAITCNVAKSLLGKDSFQEVDIAGITMPITKYNAIVMDVKDLAQTLREAFAIARSGRPGPVLIDIPKDITAAKCDFSPIKDPKDESSLIAKHPNIKRVLQYPHPSQDDLKKAADLINKCKRPIIYAGGGVKISGAEAQLLQFAQKIQSPVSMSLMARDCFPSSNRLSTWMVGMHGTKASNMAITEGDLIIALGARFSDRVYGNPNEFARNGAILHIDIDPAEIDKNIPTDCAVTGDIKEVLEKLLPLINEVKLESNKPRDEWLKKIDEWKKEYPSSYDKNPEHSINPKFICECIARVAGPDTFITTEVGQNQMWTAQFYPFEKPRTFMTSGGLGTMGYGTGASIGIQMARPNSRVVAIAGDGSFRMNCNEMATVQHYNLPIIYVIMNNSVLGNVRMWQRLFYEKRFSATDLDFGPDWVKFADAYGIRGFRATNAVEFEKAFKEAFSSKKAAIIDAIVDKDEMVLPMVPGGKPIYNMIMELSAEIMSN